MLRCSCTGTRIKIAIKMCSTLDDRAQENSPYARRILPSGSAGISFNMNLLFPARIESQHLCNVTRTRRTAAMLPIAEPGFGTAPASLLCRGLFLNNLISVLLPPTCKVRVESLRSHPQKTRRRIPSMTMLLSCSPSP